MLFRSLHHNTAKLIRDYYNSPRLGLSFHISILDIDETGYINFDTLLKNNPTTKPMVCKPNDILISCINPKIWRATIVPDLKDANWTCSSEFAIFRTKTIEESIRLYYGIMTNSFKEAALKYAKGTSSSRQRINKADLHNVNYMPPNEEQYLQTSLLLKKRSIQYVERLEDLRISSSLWRLSS